MATSDQGGVANEEVANQISIDSQEFKKTFSLEILQIIKEAQAQHGLRHGDYQRYRSYCTKRLRRLRKSLHFLQGVKNRFHGKKVTEVTLTEVKFLYIPLMLTERAWSFAMQLKQEANTEPRKRYHLLGRLHKAAKLAEDLEKLCESSKCDARTKLEAQAYCAWMAGSLQFELQQWQAALEHFRKAQTIYEKLSSALNEEEQALYRQRVDEIIPNIRYCSYNIGDKSALEDLQQMRRTVGGEDSLASKLDALISQTREKQVATLSEVTWRGRTIPVKHEKVRVFLLDAQESENEVQKALSLEAKIAVYDSLLMECKDALQVVRDELKNDPTFKPRAQVGDGPLSSLQYINTYLMFIRLSKTIERNLLMVESLRLELESGDSSTLNGTRKIPKPQDLIRLYETIIQNVGEMQQLPGVGDDLNFTQTISAQMVAYKAFRNFYIAQTFICNKKWLEAIALFDRSLSYAKAALDNRQQLDEKLVGELEDLLQTVDGQKYSAHALSVLGTDEITDHLNKMSMRNKKPLSERLDEYFEDPSLMSKQPNIAPFPPDFQPISCKPLFFDLALNHMEFPSLDDRLEQKKGGGISGLVKGWLWGGGGANSKK